MKKIIGSILLIVLIAQPSYLVFGAVAVQLESGEARRVVSIMQEDGLAVQSQVFGEYMTSIQSGTDEIYRKIEKKKEAVAKVEQKMREQAQSGLPMQFSAIQQYKQYCALKEAEELKVRSSLYAVEDLYKLTAVQQEIMKADMSYEVVEEELEKVVNKQQEILDSLEKTIQAAEELLCIF